jgi:hypothetical protein
MDCGISQKKESESKHPKPIGNLWVGSWEAIQNSKESQQWLESGYRILKSRKWKALCTIGFQKPV